MRFVIPARLFLAALLILASSATRTIAQIPRTLSYQAILTDNAGTPKPDGSYTVTFRLYAAASGGTAQWTESQVVQVKNGLFSAVLGSVTPIGPTVTFAQPYWLSLEVPPDPELPIRLPLTATGYSLGPWNMTSPGNNLHYNSGNVGIGTAAPTNKLDVVGSLRASRDISNDIIVQTTGGTNSWARLSMMTPNQRWVLGTAQNFNGDQFYLFDATNNLTRMSIQPNAGEILFPSPSSNHISVRTSGGSNSWAQLRMSTTNRTWMLGTSQEFNGDQFYLTDLTGNQARMMIQPNGGAITFPLGNVGIGTTTPTQKLDVAGSVHVSGDVGIGTTTPTQKLDVAGNVHVGGNLGTDGSAYITGNAVQNGNQGGFVKAMAYVNANATIRRSYNPYATTTAFHPSTGEYHVNFGFPTADRFYSITPRILTNAGADVPIVARFRDPAGTVVVVSLVDADAVEPIDWDFIIIVY